MIQSIPSAAGAAPGGAVGGASSLTTVGAIPYVTSAGVLGQDASALFWDATNDRLGIGTNAPTLPLDIVGSAPKIQLNRTSVSARLILENSGSAWYINSADNNALAFQTSNTERARFHSSNGNFMIGGTTDGGYKVDIQSSGSTGTLRVFDQGGAGSTLAVIQAGAGQSGNVLSIRNVGGTEQSGFDAYGQYGLELTSTFGIKVNPLNGFFAMGSAIIHAWGSSTPNSTKDLGLARNAAGVLEIDSGTAGQYRDLILRRSQHSGVAVSALPAAAAGNAGSIQYVTDANATTISSVVAGGGANKVLVWSDGANWKIMAN